MFIGDYGSKEDVQNNYAISGKAESTLNQLLREQDYYLKQAYRTLYIKDELEYYGKAKKKFKEAIHNAKSGNNFNGLLTEEIISIKPSVIVPLGDFSLRFLTGSQGITKYRGSVLPLVDSIQKSISEKYIRVIPTLPPHSIWENWTCRSYVQLDIQKILRERSRVHEPVREPGLKWICKTAEAFREFCKRQYEKANFLVFDIETFIGFPTCVSFCFDGYEAISVPLFDSTLDSTNASLLMYNVAKLLATDIPKVNQNIKYDWTIFERFGFRVNNIVGDTMLAAHLIYPELPKGLDFLTSIYTEIPYYKDEGKDYNPSNNREMLYLYNAKDSLATFQVYEKQKEELKELGLEKLYEELVIPCLHLYKEIDETGILVDIEVKEELNANYQSLYQLQYQMLCDLSETKINPLSWQQVGELLYDNLKFPKRTKQNESGEISYRTEEATLEELMILHGEDNRLGIEGRRVIEAIVACRKLNKILQFINLPLHPDNTLRTSYKLHGTETGRTSGGKSADYILMLEDGKLKKNKNGKLMNYGASLQTIPKHGFKIGDEIYGKDLRKMFVPRRGKVFVECDLSGAEARVDSILANDFDILPMFENPGIHKLTGSWLYGKDPSEIKKNTREYHLAKQVRHSGERNIQADGLVMLAYRNHLSISREEADVLLRKFHDYQPKVRGVFHKEIRDIVRGKRYLVAPNGRRRDFFARLDEMLYNEAISFLPQAIVTDQTKYAMVWTWNDLDYATYLNEAHDGSLCEIPEDKIDKYGSTYKKYVEEEIDFTTCSLSREYKLSIPCEVSVSNKSWYDLKDYSL